MATPTTPETGRTTHTTSLRTRLVLAITLTTVLAMVALGYFSFSRSAQTQAFLGSQLQQSVKKEAEGQLLSTLQQEVQSTDQFFVSVNTAVASTVRYASQLFDQEATLGKGEYWDAKQKLTPLSSGLLDNPNSDPAAIFVPAMVPVSDQLLTELNTVMYLDLVGPTVLQSNSSIVALYYIDPLGTSVYYPNIDLANIVPPDLQPAAQIFFTAAAPANNPDRKNVWTPPYQDPALTGLIVTNSAPIYDGSGRFRGIVGADVQLAKITEHINRVTIGKTGYAVLIDSAGRIIAMPEDGYEDLSITPEQVPVNETPKQTLLEQGPEGLQSVFSSMTAGASSLTRATIHGEEHYIAYAPIQSTGYSLGIIVPVSDLNAPIVEAETRIARETQATINFGLLLFLAVMLGAVLVSFGVSSVLTTPLEYLTRAAQKVGAGDLSVKAPELSSDEIGALARTFNTMTTQLRDFVGSLEQRVAERTRDLALAAEVGRSVSQVRDLDTLLAQSVELIRARFNLYYTQVYLTDSAERLLTLRAGTGVVGAELLRRSFRLPLGPGSINGTAAAEKRAVIVSDTATSSNFRPNPLLPQTRSEMAVPLLIGDRVVGVLDLQSTTPGTFTTESLPAFETLAGQLAIAIDNASLFAQTEQARTELEERAQRLTRTGWTNFLNAVDRGEHIAYTYEASARPAEDAATPATSNSQPTETHALSVPISVTGEPVGTLRVESQGSRAWTEDEAELVNAVARQVAQQIENIRLLAQAEQYRTEAEQAARRLTHAGWTSYIDSINTASGFIYDGDQVTPVAADHTATESPSITHPISVRGETIGELVVEGTESLSQDAAELLSIVATQLSTHIENLRLTEQTQSALTETQTLYETSAQLNAASSLEDILRVAVAPGITAGADNALLFIFDLDSAGKPEWMEVRANWAREGSFALPTGIRMYVPSHPMSRLWINTPDTPVLIGDAADDERLDANLRAAFTQSRTQAAAFMPLTLSGNWIGLIAIYWTGPHPFASSDLPLHKSLAAQAAVVVDNRLLFAQTRAALAESEKLYEASRRLAAASTLQDVLATVVEGVPVPVVNRAVLMAYERDPLGSFIGARVVANWHSGQGILPTPVGKHYPSEIFKALTIFLNAEPAFFDDAQNDPRVDAATRSIFVQQKIRGTAVLPLWVSGKQLGIVVIESEDPHHFTESEIRPYTSLAQQMAIAVENRRLFEQTQAALAETELLYNASRRIALAADLQEIAAAVAEAVPIPEINRAVLFEFEYDNAGQMVSGIVRANWFSGRGTLPSEVGARHPVSIFTSLTVIHNREPVFFDDLQHDGRVDPNIMAALQRLNIRSLAALPLWVAGRQVGSLLLETEELHRFSESEIRPYASLAQQMAIAVENRRLFEQTQAALSEAEDLYKASARLNAAGTPDETLLAVSQSALSSGMTSAFLFTLGLDEAGHPKEMITVSSLDAQGNPIETFLGRHFSLSDFSYSKYWLEDPYNPFVIGDVAHDERLTDGDRARMVDAGAIVVIPLVLGMRWIGVISVSWGRPHSFGEKELRLYRSLAAQAATVLDNQLLLKQTQKRAERESIINLINQKIQGATSVEAAMQTAARELGQAFKARRAVVELGTAAGPKNGK